MASVLLLKIPGQEEVVLKLLVVVLLKQRVEKVLCKDNKRKLIPEMFAESLKFHVHLKTLVPEARLSFGWFFLKSLNLTNMS